MKYLDFFRSALLVAGLGCVTSASANPALIQQMQQRAVQHQQAALQAHQQQAIQRQQSGRSSQLGLPQQAQIQQQQQSPAALQIQPIQAQALQAQQAPQQQAQQSGQIFQAQQMAGGANPGGNAVASASSLYLMIQQMQRTIGQNVNIQANQALAQSNQRAGSGSAQATLQQQAQQQQAQAGQAAAGNIPAPVVINRGASMMQTVQFLRRQRDAANDQDSKKKSTPAPFGLAPPSEQKSTEEPPGKENQDTPKPESGATPGADPKP